MRGQAGDAATDRLELGLGAAPESEERCFRRNATLNRVSKLGSVIGAEDPICDLIPPLDRSHSLDVDADVAATAQRDDQQILAVRNVEANVGGLRRAIE
jgi:hypothetical protein